MKLRWEHVDTDAGVLRLPDSKTGAKVVHLGQAAADVLRSTEREPFNPHVITGTLRASTSGILPISGTVEEQAEVEERTVEQPVGALPRRRGVAQDAVIRLLRRAEGATIADMQAATGWQPHSVRGGISGIIAKKLGRSVVSTKEALRRRHPFVELAHAVSAYYSPRVEMASSIGIEIVRKFADQTGFVVHPRRCVVERTFAWLNRNRRLARDFEHTIRSATAFLDAADAMLLIRRLARYA
jgi:hypothetical protein